MAEKFGEGPVEGEQLKKRRLRKMVGVAPLEIPRGMFPPDVDLMWVADSINGQPCADYRQQFEINGWEPVSQEMFDGRFDGMFMRKGQRGQIMVGELVLMWRPMELSIESHAEERAEALRATQATENRIKRGEVEGLDPNFADQKSAAARANTRVVRTIEPGAPIPR